jgi:poly(beta-D-mannuronate) lyase
VEAAVTTHPDSRNTARTGCRRAAVTAASALVLAAPPATAGTDRPAVTAPPRVVPVASIAELQNAAANASPGDRIELADGTYKLSAGVRLSRSGTAAAPITIAAAHVGRVDLTGSTGFAFGDVSYVTVEGFRFLTDGGLDVPAGARFVRLSRNVFQITTGVAIGSVTVAGDDTEVDHNTFQNKSTHGVFLQISGPGAHDMSKRVHVHHNYFFNHTYSGANGGESIRVGFSFRQHGSAQAIVEYNLLEKANGDSEAISVKSSDNIIRYNTLRNSRGQITLRHGNRNRVEGNVMLGGSSGIRTYGNDHIVVNNVVQNTGGQAVEIGGGEIKDDTDNTTSHEASDRILFAFNTLVSNRSPQIKVGGGKKYAPDGITFADNLIQGSGSGSAATISQGTNLLWAGNVGWQIGRGAIPTGGYRSVNPGLVQDAGGLWRLTAGSPVIDTATGAYPQVTQDLDQQQRTGAKDVGADEYAPGPVRLPLTVADVGPSAP